MGLSIGSFNLCWYLYDHLGVMPQFRLAFIASRTSQGRLSVGWSMTKLCHLQLTVLSCLLVV